MSDILKLKPVDHRPPIAYWKHKKEDACVACDGKIFFCDFKKFIKNPGVEPYSRFMVNKSSYEKQLPEFSRYINFFEKFYDPEHELILAYFKLKYAIDKEKNFAIPEGASVEKRDEIINGFIQFCHMVLFAQSDSNHIAEHISELAEDNYLDDIEGQMTKKKNNDREYLESLEFTNTHVKLMLKISFAMKILAPVMFHYLFVNQVKLEKDSQIIYRFYKPLFSLFDPEVNLFNKLYVYVKSRVLESSATNSTMFEKRQIFGSDVFVVISSFVKKVIISENMVKYAFPETWDETLGKYKENVVGLNKTLVKFQLDYFIKEMYEKNLTEVSNIKNSEGLSGADKMEMNIRKIDEGKAVAAKFNANDTFEKIRTMMDIPVTKDELEYMKNNWKPTELQIRLINSYYAQYFGNYRDTYLNTRDQFYTLAIILKKRLLIESGYVGDTGEVLSVAALPYILTGNLVGKANNRIIRNNKYLASLDEDEHYKILCNDIYSQMLEIHPDEIKQCISTLANNTFTYVTPECEELTGHVVECTAEKVGAELIQFLYESDMRG